MTMHIISLGAGVQSTTMALMAAHDEIKPMPHVAIFCDTGWEPRAVYDHLAWLTRDGFLPFPVIIVRTSNIRDDLLARGSTTRKAIGNYVTIPAFLLHNNGKDAIGRRQCTAHYKVEPMRRKVRELIGRPKGPIPAGFVTKWLGISVDEIIRATPSRVKFEINRFPLIEQAMHRQDCIKWLTKNGYPTPPKSACIGCPYRSDAGWRAIKAEPAEWAQAVEVDAAIRKPVNRASGAEMKAEQFLHRQMVPLDKVDLATEEERGQMSLFDHECEGMCGV